MLKSMGFWAENNATPLRKKMKKIPKLQLKGSARKTSENGGCSRRFFKWIRTAMLSPLISSMKNIELIRYNFFHSRKKYLAQQRLQLWSASRKGNYGAAVLRRIPSVGGIQHRRRKYAWWYSQKRKIIFGGFGRQKDLRIFTINSIPRIGTAA